MVLNVLLDLCIGTVAGGSHRLKILKNKVAEAWDTDFSEKLVNCLWISSLYE